MNVLLFAIPIILFIVIITIVFVITSDSNKHVQNLSNEEQIRLDRLKQEVLNDIRNHKGDSISDSKEEVLIEKNNSKTSVVKETIKNHNILTKQQFKNDILEQNKSSKKLTFTKKNVIRGMLASQYLPKKTRR